jgi:chromosome segregation ATPase
LKEENKAYQSINHQLVDLIDTANKKCDTIFVELSENRTQMNTFIDSTNSEFANMERDIAEIRETILDASACLNNYKTQLQQLSIEMNKNTDVMSDISTISSDLKSLTEYVNCLWSATKALWVDSLLSDFDDSIDFEDINKKQQRSKTTKATSGYDDDYYWAFEHERD